MSNVTINQLIEEVSSVVDGDPMEFIASAVRNKLALMQQGSADLSSTSKDRDFSPVETHSYVCPVCNGSCISKETGEDCYECDCKGIITVYEILKDIPF